MVDVDFAWSTDDVTKMTDTDLTATREKTMYGIDETGEAHRRVLALADYLSNGDTWNVPQSGDHALRIYLAYLMDSQRVEDIRDRFDVAYTIPSPGWAVSEFEPYDVDLESVDDEQVHERFSITVPPVVHEMVKYIVENEDRFDEQSEVVVAAIRHVTQ